MGNIAADTLYRSSHPIKHNKQEKIISMLAEKSKISKVINLHDTYSNILSKAYIAPWYYNLLNNKSIIALGMDFSVTSSSFKQKLKKALQFIIQTEGPWLIHCHAGVDRTGFVCMVLESFMGASLDNVIKDYLFSFDSIFTSNIHVGSQKADSALAMKILSVMSDTQVINEQNLAHIAEIYLRFKVGLSVGEVELLKMKLAG